MILRVLVYFGGLVTILAVAGTIGLFPGMRPDAEAQVYGTTPIPPALEVQPVRPVVEAIPAAPAAVTPAVVAAPVTPSTPVTPAAPPPTEVLPLQPEAPLSPAPAAPAPPTVEVEPLRTAPATETAVQAAAQAQVQAQAQAPQALPRAGTGGVMQADSPMQVWLLVSLAGIFSILAAGTTIVRRAYAQQGR